VLRINQLKVVDRAKQVAGGHRHRAIDRIASPGVGVPVLLLTHAALLATSISQKSATYDEPAHIIRGLSLWEAGDYRLLQETPPLVHLWATLSLQADRIHTTFDGPPWHESDAWQLSRQILFESGNDAKEIIFRCRMMMIVFSLGLGYLVWQWSAALYGRMGGLFSLTLYAFCPTILANGALVTTDVPSAFFFMLCLVAMWRMLRQPTARNTLLSGLCLGLLAVTKMSFLIMAPVTVLLVLANLLLRGTPDNGPRSNAQISRCMANMAVLLAKITAMALVVFSLIWLIYTFRWSAMRQTSAGEDHFFTPVPLNAGIAPWDYVLSGVGVTGRLIAFARNCHLLPESFLYGLAYTVKHAQARNAFLLGQYSARGWWYFFPYTFLVKTTVPTLLVLVLAAIRGTWNGPLRRHKSAPGGLERDSSVFASQVPLLIFVFLYACVVMTSNLNIGHRHLIPMYPPIFILCGSVGTWLDSDSNWRRWGSRLAAVSCALCACSVWPDYLSFNNSLGGGMRNGYKHLVDSSLDWGQDLPALRKWLTNQHLLRSGFDSSKLPVFLSYFGTAYPTAYGLNPFLLPSIQPWHPAKISPLLPGIYCISATMLQGVGIFDEYGWNSKNESAYWLLRAESLAASRGTRAPLNASENQEYWDLTFGRLCRLLRKREPDGFAGYSIVIYRVSADELQRALDAPISEPSHTPAIKKGVN